MGTAQTVAGACATLLGMQGERASLSVRLAGLWERTRVHPLKAKGKENARDVAWGHYLFNRAPNFLSRFLLFVFFSCFFVCFLNPSTLLLSLAALGTGNRAVSNTPLLFPLFPPAQWMEPRIHTPARSVARSISRWGNGGTWSTDVLWVRHRVHGIIDLLNCLCA